MTMISSTSDTPVAALDVLFSPYDRSDAPGLVVGVARDGEVFYRRAFGMASLEHARANTTATRMRIGSTSKHFTCAAALRLQDEGLIDIGQPVGAYLPELLAQTGAPTLSELMSHRGGQRCGLDLALITQGLALGPAGAILATQQRQQDANFKPGERMMYANGGYHLLSLALARAADMPFEEVLRTRLFASLGMHHTVSLPNDMRIAEGIATLHVPDGAGGFRRGLFPSWEVLGEGAIVSTVDDLLRWTAHLRAAGMLQRLVEMPVYASGLQGQYGLGLKRNDYRGVTLVHHAGGVIGGTAQMALAPAYGLDVVLMSNGAVPVPVELVKRVVDVVLADVLEGDGPPGPVRAADHVARLGTYRAARTNAVFSLVAHDDALALVGFASPQQPLPLFESDVGLAIETASEGAIALSWDDANSDMLQIAHCGHPERFERLPAAPALDASLIEALCGVYASHDANSRATIFASDDGLRLRMRGGAGGLDYRLTPLADDVFAFFAADPTEIMSGVLTAIRDAQGAIDGFALDTWRTRHLVFTRLQEPM